MNYLDCESILTEQVEESKGEIKGLSFIALTEALGEQEGGIRIVIDAWRDGDIYIVNEHDMVIGILQSLPAPVYDIFGEAIEAEIDPSLRSY